MCVDAADSEPIDFLDAYSKILDIQIYNYYTRLMPSKFPMSLLSSQGVFCLALAIVQHLYMQFLQYFVVSPIRKMELGISVAIYLVLSLVFLSLICLLPKYFHYRMRKEDPNLAGSEMMSQELQSHSSLEEEEDTNQAGFGSKEKTRAKSPFFNNTKYEIELDDEKQMPREIFGGSTLMKKLNNQLSPLKPSKPLTKDSLKEIKATQLSSTKFMNSRLALNEAQKSQVFKFVSKLVSYEEDTITVIQVDMRSIKKDETNNIIENKKIENYQVKMKEEGEEVFCKMLEELKLEMYQYGSYKVITKVHINDMAKNAQYKLQSLKTSQNTEWISEQQFKKQQQAIITYI